MKRFQFRLERILRLKRQRERQAELRQGQARAAADNAHANCTAIERQLAQQAAELSARPVRGMTPELQIAGAACLAQIQQQLNLALNQARKADMALAEANQARAKCHRDVQSIELLRNNAVDSHRRDTAYEHQSQLDDLSIQRWRQLASQPERHLVQETHQDRELTES